MDNHKLSYEVVLKVLREIQYKPGFHTIHTPILIRALDDYGMEPRVTYIMSSQCLAFYPKGLEFGFNSLVSLNGYKKEAGNSGIECAHFYIDGMCYKCLKHKSMFERLSDFLKRVFTNV